MKKLLVLLILTYSLSAGQIDTVHISGKVSPVSAKAIVALPDQYQTNPEAHFAVVYLLHGVTGSFKDWQSHTDLAPLSDKYGFIIVCPDGGNAGFYLDSPLNPDSQYESYIIKDVISFIDKKYHTVDSAKGRYITGLSMGGHGAVRLFALHPEMFGAAGSMSGVLELNERAQKYGLDGLLGSYHENRKIWYEASCMHLVENLKDKNKSLFLDCGVEDKFISDNRKMHQKLLDLDIKHDYIERPGGHSWTYWVNALEYHLLYFYKVHQSG